MATLDAMIGPQATPWADLLIDTMMTDERSESDGFTSKWVTASVPDLEYHRPAERGCVAARQP
jgi:hypothetical protein